MTEDGSYTAVVDRFEDELAVLLLEEDGETVGEVVVEQERLPQDGRHVDAVLQIELEDEEPVDVMYEAEETVDRSERTQSRFDSLSQRPPSEEDEGDSS